MNDPVIAEMPAENAFAVVDRDDARAVLEALVPGYDTSTARRHAASRRRAAVALARAENVSQLRAPHDGLSTLVVEQLSANPARPTGTGWWGEDFTLWVVDVAYERAGLPLPTGNVVVVSARSDAALLDAYLAAGRIRLVDVTAHAGPVDVVDKKGD